jgi:hypothetical protein
VILFPAADPSAAQIAVERLRSVIERHPWPLCPVTASFGVATLGTEARVLRRGPREAGLVAFGRRGAPPR